MCCYSAVSTSAAEEMNTGTADVKRVTRTKKKRRKQKYSSAVDEDDSSDVLEQSAAAVITPTRAARCLRSHDSAAAEQVKKRRCSSEIDDEDKDCDYEPEAVSRPKRRKNRQRWALSGTNAFIESLQKMIITWY